MKKLLFAIFIISVSIIGCEVPYTGPLLSVDDVDRYLKSTGEDTVCLQDGFDSVCLKVVEKEVEKEDKSDEAVPIIHIHPTGVTYEFYYEGHRILRAERAMDTSQIAQELVDTGRAKLPPNSELLGAGGDPGNNGDGDNISSGWTIRIYYPESFPEENRGPAFETSGLEIRVVEGMRLLPNDTRDLKIKNFTQIDGTDDSRSAEFSVETDASAIMIRVGGLIQGQIAKFRINTDGVVSDEGTNTFQLQPVR